MSLVKTVEVSTGVTVSLVRDGSYVVAAHRDESTICVKLDRDELESFRDRLDQLLEGGKAG